VASGVLSLVLDAELGIEMALLDVRLLARFLVEDMAAVLGGVRRRIEMQANSDLVLTRVRNPVQPKVVAHIRHLITLIGGRPLHVQARWLKLARHALGTGVLGVRAGRIGASSRALGSAILATLTGPRVQSLGQPTLQDPHDAVRIGVVVDGTTLPWSPDEDQEVALAIAVIDEVTGVAAAVVCKSELLPLLLDGRVVAHGGLEFLDIDAGAVDAIAGAEDGVDGLYETVESVGWFWGASGGVVDALRLAGGAGRVGSGDQVRVVGGEVLISVGHGWVLTGSWWVGYLIR